jgi:hypothetical protein
MDVSLEVDARGGLHPLLGAVGTLAHPAAGPYLPRFGLNGNALTLEVTRRQGLDFRHPWLVAVSAKTLEPGEPSLRRPLDAGDSAPRDGCLRYPRGGVAHGEVC